MNLFKIFGQIAVDTADAEAGLSRAGSAAEKTESKMGKAFDKIGSAAVACGKVIATGLAAGAAAFGALSIKALNLAGDLEQNLGGAEAVFGEFASKMEEHASKAFSSMGLSASDYLATANKMGSLFKGAGFEASEAADLTATAMQRAADVASIMGIDVSVAMESVAGAAKGNYTMMDNLGVAMNDTNLQAYALSKGIEKSTNEMTSQEKIGLAMKMFLEKTADYAGNYAKENDTLAGSLTTAKAALSNFLSGVGDASEVGDALIKAGSVIGQKLTALLPSLVSGISSLLNSLIPEIPPLLESLLPALIDGAVALVNGLVSAAGQIVNALMGIAPDLIDAAIQIMATIASALIDNIDSILDSALQIIMMFGQALVDNMPQIASAARTIIEKLCYFIANNADKIVNLAVQLIEAIVTGIIKNLPKLVKPILGAIMSLCKSLFDGVLDLGWDLGKGLAKAFGYAIPEVEELTAKTYEYTEAESAALDGMYESIEALDKLQEEYEKNASTILDETQRTEDLWKELQSLCDETGYVDEANRDRAEYILGELNDALGTEYLMNDGIIGQYQMMQTEIDELIKKRQAERLLASGEDEYTAAKESHSNTVTAYGTAKRALESERGYVDDYWNRFLDKHYYVDELIADYMRIYSGSTREEAEAFVRDIRNATWVEQFGGVNGNWKSDSSGFVGYRWSDTERTNINNYKSSIATKEADLETAENTLDEENAIIYRYESAENALLNGDYGSVESIMLDGVESAMWSALKNGDISVSIDSDALKTDLSNSLDYLRYYAEQLANGKEGYSLEELENLSSALQENAASYRDYMDSQVNAYESLYGQETIDNALGILYDAQRSTGGGGGGADVLRAPVDVYDILPRISEGIVVSPVSFADEEKSTMTEIKSSVAALTAAIESLLMGGLSVRMNGREFGRLVRTVKE